MPDEPIGDPEATSAQEALGILNRLHPEFRKTIIMVMHGPKAAKAASVVRHLGKGEQRPLERAP